jgi:hypothetical protein
LKASQRKEEELSGQRGEVKSTIAKVDQEVTQLLGKLQVAEGKLQRLVDERQPLLEGLLRAQEEEDRLKTKLARLEKQGGEHKGNMEALETEIKMWREEVASGFEKDLSDEEEDTMKRLTEEVDRTKKEMVEVTKEVAEVRSFLSFFASPFFAALAFPPSLTPFFPPSSSSARTFSNSSLPRTFVVVGKSSEARSRRSTLALRRLLSRTARRITAKTLRRGRAS